MAVCSGSRTMLPVRCTSVSLSAPGFHDMRTHGQHALSAHINNTVVWHATHGTLERATVRDDRFQRFHSFDANTAATGPQFPCRAFLSRTFLSGGSTELTTSCTYSYRTQHTYIPLTNLARTTPSLPRAPKQYLGTSHSASQGGQRWGRARGLCAKFISGMYVC